MLRIKYIFIICFLSFNFSFAAGPPGNGGGNGNGNGNPGGGACWPPVQCVPIDEGILFLFFGGLIYGGIKVYEINRKLEESQ